MNTNDVNDYSFEPLTGGEESVYRVLDGTLKFPPNTLEDDTFRHYHDAFQNLPEVEPVDNFFYQVLDENGNLFPTPSYELTYTKSIKDISKEEIMKLFGYQHMPTITFSDKHVLEILKKHYEGYLENEAAKSAKKSSI